MILPSAGVASDEARSVMVMAGGGVRKQTDFGERYGVAAVGARSAARRSAAILEWAREVQTCFDSESIFMLWPPVGTSPSDSNSVTR